MSKHQKLLERFLSRPKNFTYRELKTLMSSYGFVEEQSRKGSAVAFINYKDSKSIRLHKPHPGNELKPYQIDDVIEGMIDYFFGN